MKKLMLLTAAAALLTPALMASPASAETDVNVRINAGSPGYYHRGYRAYGQQRTVVSGPHCRTVTTHTRRPNGTMSVRKIRKCG